jgi:uncharacterized protein (TIGR04442 family)
MRKDIRLHGMTDNHLEYFAYLAGADVCERYAFNISQEDNDVLRIFSSGNEFVIGRDGVSYNGNGGAFCEYMFGIDQPLADLAKRDVLNRLAMYGAHYEEKSGSLQLTDRTEGEQSYEKIFFEGNAVCNYFFFVNATDISGSLKKQQKEILRILGKTIKRSSAVGAEDDDTITGQILSLFKDPRARLFIFKLINRKHKEYRDFFSRLYFRNKTISDEDFAELTAVADSYRIDRYQQERIRVDVMYKHRANRGIVDEYRNILITCYRKGEINKPEIARLNRLKTLSVRNKIPDALFYPLDEILKKDIRIVGPEEDAFLSETRQILEGLFLHERHIENSINSDDMVKLLYAKKHAAANCDYAFEEILLDTSKACDEKIRDGADAAILEGLSSIITYFDRYDSTSSIINKLAFMENVRISEEMLRSVLGNKREFDTLQQGLFKELFISELLVNQYLGNYGRRKVKTLLNGLCFIEENRLTILGLLDQLREIDREERLFIIVRDCIRDRVRNFQSRYTSKANQEILKTEVTEELRRRKLLDGEIPDGFFRETIHTVRKEAVYLQTILPQIITEKNISLREDFLQNSGLDRFYVEELEREYCNLNCIDIIELNGIRAVKQLNSEASG